MRSLILFEAESLVAKLARKLLAVCVKGGVFVHRVSALQLSPALFALVGSEFGMSVDVVFQLVFQRALFVTFRTLVGFPSRMHFLHVSANLTFLTFHKDDISKVFRCTYSSRPPS